MRMSTLLLLVPLAACAAEPEEFAVVEDFLARSDAVSCEALTAGRDVAVTELRTASDSTVLVLDAPGRRIVEFDHDLRPVWEMEAPAAGPASLEAPVSAVLVGDTAVAVAERKGFRLLLFSRAGAVIQSTPLQFVPHSLAAPRAGGILVTAMPMGGRPGTLVVRYDGERLEEVDVPLRSYDDMLVGALGNSALVEPLPDGGAMVVHQFLSPRGFLVRADGVVEPRRVPTPDATVESVSYVPTAPITEEHIRAMLVPAMAMSIDPVRSEVYLLTRSGRRVDGRTERAVLRLDDRLGVLASFTLDVRATTMVFLPGREAVLVVDDEDRFHSCALPREAAHARAD